MIHCEILKRIGLFAIASIRKPFTGLLLQDMIERGEMTLDASMQKYLPASSS